MGYAIKLNGGNGSNYNSLYDEESGKFGFVFNAVARLWGFGHIYFPNQIDWYRGEYSSIRPGTTLEMRIHVLDGKYYTGWAGYGGVNASVVISLATHSTIAGQIAYYLYADNRDHGSNYGSRIFNLEEDPSNPDTSHIFIAVGSVNTGSAGLILCRIGDVD